jgi:acyl carrier protein
METDAEKTLLRVVNTVRANKGLEALLLLTPDQDLRRDLGFDSLDLAELTVRLEAETGVDVFANGLVATVGEVIRQL